MTDILVWYLRDGRREPGGPFHSGEEGRKQEGIETIVNESAKHILDTAEEVGLIVLEVLSVVSRWLSKEGFGGEGDDRELRRIT